MVGIAAVAMVATLPGRTFGLGLITEPLLRDVGVSKLQYGQLNLWATLIGATFCLGCGKLIDRLGSRLVLTTTLLLLGATVLAMSHVHGLWGLLVTLVLTRGFGQSVLSVVSLTLVGKWFERRLPMAMGVYSVLIGIGFIAAILGVGYVLHGHDWRLVWHWIGWILLAGLAPLALLLCRRSPESMGVKVDGEAGKSTTNIEEDATPHSHGAAESSLLPVLRGRAGWGPSFASELRPSPFPNPPPEYREREQNADVDDLAQNGVTLFVALLSPAFWVYALSASVYGLIASGLMLFNEAVLKDRGFSGDIVQNVLALSTFAGLAANLLGGWLARSIPIGRLLAAAMVLLAASLVCLPLAHNMTVVYLYAAMNGLAGGIVTMGFFVCWGQVFGRKYLGSIQGAAQALTVLASAAGPLMLAHFLESRHLPELLLFGLAPVVMLLGFLCAVAPLPGRNQG
jgi:MFS family permease